MEFCEKCQFMLYTKLETKEDGNTIELINYCKNCGFEKKKDTNDNSSIYKRNYQQNFIADKCLNNKYTIYDVTLPRLKINCVNSKCITNFQIEKNLSFIVKNVPEIQEEVDNIFESDNEKIDKIIPIKITTILVIVKDEDDRDELKNKYNNFEFSQGEFLTTTDFEEVGKEVLYIKYDPENMKYLYMCVNCGTSWLGNTERKG